MDPELLKQKAEFKKRALATPSIQGSKRSAPADEGEGKSRPSAAKIPKTSGASFGVSTSSTPQFDSKSAAATASASAAAAQFSTRFGTMARIVDHMKKRHLQGDQWPLSLDEILQELMVFDVSNKEKQWLDTAV